MDIKAIEHLLGYFDPKVLAAYRDEPQKYVIGSDYFDGRLSVTNEYSGQLQEIDEDDHVDIRFGYRTLESDDLAIVAWLPDIFEKSKQHANRWAAFHIKSPKWTSEVDERFEMWVKRYIEGSWEIDNGPAHYIAEHINTVNAVTMELIDLPLFKYKVERPLSFPAAQNTHRYQDAHKELYGYLIDGLNKDCILKLSDYLRRPIKVGDKNTVQSIYKLFPQLESTPKFKQAFDAVSNQRRLAAHGVRPPATHFRAFEQFTEDLFLCLGALEELNSVLEGECKVDSEKARARYESRKYLPLITRPPEPHHAICRADLLVGKTIERVEYGFRREIEDVHQSEALIIYFTDGSIMSIDTGSNAWNVASDLRNGNLEGIKPSDFHVDLHLHWVSSLK